MTLASDSDLRLNLEPQKVLHSINDRIRRLLALPDILNAAVEELRVFLATDRVMVYKFHADGNGQVIAESINQNKLPSLLNLNFPTDDIPAHTRELFVHSRVRSIVNVDTRQIAQNTIGFNGIGNYRPVDPCHAEYLTAMGVQSSIVVPILYHEKLWGLLVSHHSQPRTISNPEVDTVQIVADLLAVAIAYITPLQDARLKAHREAIINRISDRLHSLPDMDLQAALEETVAAFGGCGGRLCIRSETTYQAEILQSFIECLTDNTKIEVYEFGKQPIFPKTAKYNLIEQYSVWEEHYKGNYSIWAISDIYQTGAALLKRQNVTFVLHAYNSSYI